MNYPHQAGVWGISMCVVAGRGGMTGREARGHQVALIPPVPLPPPRAWYKCNEHHWNTWEEPRIIEGRDHSTQMSLPPPPFPLMFGRGSGHAHHKCPPGSHQCHNNNNEWFGVSFGRGLTGMD